MTGSVVVILLNAAGVRISTGDGWIVFGGNAKRINDKIKTSEDSEPAKICVTDRPIAQRVV